MKFIYRFLTVFGATILLAIGIKLLTDFVWWLADRGTSELMVVGGFCIVMSFVITIVLHDWKDNP